MIQSVFDVEKYASEGKLDTKLLGVRPSKWSRKASYFESLTGKYVEIDEAKAQQIINSTERGLEKATTDATTVEEFMDVVGDKYYSYEKSRSSTIGITEASGAFNYGAIGTVSDEALAEFKIWCCAFSNSREWHEEADGQTVPVEEMFDVDGEDMFCPGDPDGSDENVINCQCWLDFTNEGPSGSLFG